MRNPPPPPSTRPPLLPQRPASPAMDPFPPAMCQCLHLSLGNLLSALRLGCAGLCRTQPSIDRAGLAAPSSRQLGLMAVNHTYTCACSLTNTNSSQHLGSITVNCTQVCPRSLLSYLPVGPLPQACVNFTPPFGPLPLLLPPSPPQHNKPSAGTAGMTTGKGSCHWGHGNGHQIGHTLLFMQALHAFS